MWQHTAAVLQGHLRPSINMAMVHEPPPSEERLHPALADFLAGGVAGGAGVIAGQPLDTARIRMQQPGRLWTSAAACLRATAVNEGITALFRGTSYPLATISLQNAVVFQAFGAAIRALTCASSSSPSAGQPGCQLGATYTLPTLRQTFAAGMVAGVIQTAVVAPVELLKIRQQLQTVPVGRPGYIGPIRLLRTILAQEGLRGLYRGGAVTLARDIPSHGVYFCTYDISREAMDPGSRTRGASKPWAGFTAGGLAGAASWLSIYPIDIVKSRMQATSCAGSRFKSIADCVIRSFNEEGLQVFVRGLGPTLARAFLVNAVIFSVYEGSVEALSC